MSVPSQNPRGAFWDRTPSKSPRNFQIPTKPCTSFMFSGISQARTFSTTASGETGISPHQWTPCCRTWALRVLWVQHPPSPSQMLQQRPPDLQRVVFTRSRDVIHVMASCYWCGGGRTGLGLSPITCCGLSTGRSTTALPQWTQADSSYQVPVSAGGFSMNSLEEEALNAGTLVLITILIMYQLPSLIIYMWFIKNNIFIAKQPKESSSITSLMLELSLGYFAINILFLWIYLLPV